MANMYMKRFSASLVIREMKIKTRCHFTHVRMATIKKVRDKCCQGCGVKGTLGCTVGGNVNWCSHYGEQYGGSSKN